MSQDQHSQDLNFNLQHEENHVVDYYETYREAAEQDDFLFSEISLEDYLKIYYAEVES
jgi:GH18 family chitinase